MGSGASKYKEKRVHFADVIPIPNHLPWREAIKLYNLEYFPLKEAMELAWPLRLGPTWYAVACSMCKRRNLVEEIYVGALVLGMYVCKTCATLEERREQLLKHLDQHNEPSESKIFLMRFEHALGFYDTPKVQVQESQP